MLRKVLITLGIVVVVLVGSAITYLLAAPPDLLRVATGYSAKMVCSNVFLAGRDPEQVLAVDVQAPGHWLLKYVGVDVDRSEGIVTARLLGLFAPSTSIHWTGLGCAAVPDGNIAAAKAIQLTDAPIDTGPVAGAWPDGDAVAPAQQAALDAAFGNDALTGPGMRAVVVVKGGQIVAETYGEGFGPQTPLIGWSMTKTVNAILIGRLALENRIGLDDTGLRPEWTDARKNIRLRDLLGMEAGLVFNEDYGDVSDVNRMLFLEPDMAKFAGSLPQIAAPDTAFNYSTGTSVLLSRIWMDRIGDDGLARTFPRTALFDPLGMKSALLEADAAGTLTGGSYVYATARDWARIGLFLLRDGEWNGAAMLPEGWVSAMQTSNGLPGEYSQMQTWLQGPHDNDAADGVPEDAFWLLGHDGQSIAVVPSEDLVVVRMGLTPSKLEYHPERLTAAIIAAL